MRTWRTYSVVFALIAALAISPCANAASISLASVVRKPSEAAVDAGAPAGGKIYQFFVTTNADVLSIGNVQVSISNGGSLFQVPFGSDRDKPDPALVALFRSLEADSWVDTPGETLLFGPGLPGDGTGVWGDFTNNGPQLNFRFAQLTVAPGYSLIFQGSILVGDLGGYEERSFTFIDALTPPDVPEPSAALMAGVGILGVVSARRKWTARR